MQKSYNSIRIFNNSILEKFTHVHPVTPAVIWVPIFCWLGSRNWDFLLENPLLVGALAVSGFTVWTLIEYLLHRFLFHFESDTAIGQRIQFLIHGLHHADPLDPSRLVMPPVASLLLGAVLFLIFRVFLGPIWINPFFSFFILGYLSYDYIHFYVHHFAPTTRFGKYLKNSHMQHHYVNPRTRWGVSSPFWDHVFGTIYSEYSKKMHDVHTSAEELNNHKCRQENLPEGLTPFKENLSSHKKIENSL